MSSTPTAETVDAPGPEPSLPDGRRRYRLLAATSLPLGAGRARGARAEFARPQRIARADLRVVALVAATITGLLAVVSFIGADARWLAALGSEIARRHSIPAGLPFAPNASPAWPNTLVLAEISFHALISTLGDRGLMLAQLAAVALGIVVLMRDAIVGGATRQGTATAVMLGSLAALPALATARVQLYSIALFPVCAALLRRQAQNPTRKVWSVVPLLAVWSNLHGGALIGLGLTLAYLLLNRARTDPRTAIAVSLAAGAAMCLTPAGIRTASYYDGVLTNVAAERGQGLWSPISLTSPLDLLFIAAAIVLALKAFRSRPRAWEIVVLAALALMTFKAGRSGVWLVLFLVPLAARSFKSRVVWDRALPALTTAAIVGLVFGVLRGPLNSGSSERLISRAIALSHDTPVLAEDALAEQVALAGGKIWAGNPIDAFPRNDQAEYLAWMTGQPSGVLALAPDVHVVLVGRGAPARRLLRADPNFRVIASDRTTELYVRSGSP